MPARRINTGFLKRILTIIFIWFMIGIFVIAQTDHYRFSRININDGLSNNQINYILKDNTGFMWFATMSGLNRFDGYNFKIFRHDPRDSASVNDNFIDAMYEDHQGKLWINTRKGINIYNPNTESFIHNPIPLLTELNIQDISLSKIIKDKKGDYIYIGSRSGLYIYSSQNNHMINVHHDPENPSSLATNFISDCSPDQQNDLWIIHQNGIIEKLDSINKKVIYRNDFLYKKYKGQTFRYTIFLDSDDDAWIYMPDDDLGIYYFNTGKKVFKHLHKDSPGARLNSNIVQSVVQDNNNLIWIGTDHGGINLYDKKTQTMQYLSYNEEDEKSLSQNCITYLYKDDSGIIWVGTYKKGINYFNEGIIKFRLFKHRASDPNSLIYDDVDCFAEDKYGNLWIGTNGGGLLYYDRKKNHFRQYIHNPDDPNTISNNVIVCLFIDHQNKLWIGTYYGGLSCFDGKRFTHYRHDPSNPETLADDRIWEIFEDSENNLWIGTLGSGLDKFDRKKNKFIHYRPGNVEFIHLNFIVSIIEDKKGNLWIGGENGIDVFIKNNNTYNYFSNDLDDTSSLSNNNIYSIFEDSRGLIWIGTREGLNLFNKKDKTFRVFTTKDGLPDNAIVMILEDDKNNLWISTRNGLSNVIVSKNGINNKYVFNFKNYDELDGLQGKEFNENAAIKTSKGELIFGGANGFNLFNTDEIKENTITPRIAFTDFQIFNKSIQIGEEINGRVLLDNSINRSKEIVLKYKENVFSIEFASLSYFHPGKNKYKYKLEGFNSVWLETDGNSRKATFTNMDPGEYTFRVKACNNDGYWNEEGIHLNIKILPPFWKTPFAFISYIVIIAGILLLSRKLILDRERMKHKIAQERQEAKHLHELDMMKIRFFTNISHEFRTPLSLITGPLEKIFKNNNNAEHQKQYVMITRNVKRLLNLVNQLLDFRKMEVGEFRYIPTEGEIIGFIREVSESFSDLAEKKKINFVISANIEKLEMVFDQDKLEKILFNLLSNAFKFTPESQSITVDIKYIKKEDAPKKEKKYLEITVSDTGIGIPKDKHNKIFERFFQNAVPGSIVNRGSGIGLSLTKEFVKLHNGKISLKSESNIGTSFKVLLPVKSADEYFADLSTDNLKTKIPKYEFPENIAIRSKTNKIDHKKSLILLVEDNEDFRFYLKDNLLEFYNIIEATDGVEGWHKALHSIPDLIVSDIVMPEMDGIELCDKIKNDQRTSHIPVILLTGRTGEEKKIRSFKTGADDFLTKPFNFEILQSRINNLIAIRKALQNNFQKQMEINPKEISITSLDEKLIQKALDLVEVNISNPDFSVKELSQELGMSRVHLYKKLSSLTGKTPIEFIRIIRLKRAAQLIRESQLTISEIAYEVGFNNPKYFTKYFKAEFKTLPSLYAEQKKTQNIK